ncbi:hypothetical protein PYW07_016453 [Mythimna separata]|uniref:FLYWCH-type domain-containing protein n=1 Tax=Mythimna separata TaxID=271217 RepID=A0AAD7YKM4_MYTSE|nr:hypothetical protein PYW07_016453 [Mythimna separata]
MDRKKRKCYTNAQVAEALSSIRQGPVFTMSSRGGRILRLSGHRLRQQYSRNGKTRWQCSTHMNKGCKAIVFTIEGGAVYARSKRGARVIILEGYSFYHHRTTGPKTRWFCASHHNKGCKAAIFTVRDEIIKANNEHYHPASEM